MFKSIVNTWKDFWYWFGWNWMFFIIPTTIIAGIIIGYFAFSFTSELKKTCKSACNGKPVIECFNKDDSVTVVCGTDPLTFHYIIK